MPIRLTCSCGKVLSAPDAAAGKAIKCPGCQKAIRVPGGSAAGPAAPKSGGPSKAPGPAKAASPAKPAAPGKAAASRPAPAPSLPVGPAAAQMVDGSLDDLFSEAGFQLRTGKTCPSCLAALDQDAVLCTQCGFNFTTGEKIQGHVTEFEDEHSGEAYLKRAALDMERSKQMQEKMTKGAGMPWWVLLLVLFFLGSATSVGVIAVNMSRRVDATETFDAVGTLLMLSTIGTGAIGVGALLLALFRFWVGWRKKEPFGSMNVIKPLILSVIAGGVAGGLFAAYSQRM